MKRYNFIESIKRFAKDIGTIDYFEDEESIVHFIFIQDFLSGEIDTLYESPGSNPIYIHSCLFKFHYKRKSREYFNEANF